MKRMLGWLLWGLLALAPALPAWGACSILYSGKASLNEYYFGNDTNFIEVMILNNTQVPPSVWSTWRVAVYDAPGPPVLSFNLNDPNLRDCSSGSKSYLTYYVAGNLPSPAGSGLNVVLFDASGNEIDYLKFSQSSPIPQHYVPTCSSFAYDTDLQLSSLGSKDVARFPDGKGDWDLSGGTGSGTSYTPCAGNNATILKAVSASSVPIGSTAFFSITVANPDNKNSVTAVRVNDLLPAGLGYVSHVASPGTTYTPATGLWNIGTLVASSSATLTLTFRGNVLGTYTNTASLTYTDNKGNAQTGSDFAGVTVVPATSASRFVLSHDGFGINCLAEPLRVTAVNASGSAVTGYTGTITLNTQSGKGTWSLASGSGSFSDPVANDGLASYTFVAGDAGTVLFNLAYPEGATPLNILVSAGDIVDDNTEGLLAFTPSGFTVTSAPLNNPPPAVIPAFANQTAGTNFTAYLTAYGQTATDPLCGVIEAYAGARSLRFWTGYSNPAYAGLAAPVRPTVTAAATTISADKFENETATGLSVNFVAGQGQVTVKYKDVGRIGLNLKDVATPADPVSLPSGIRGDSGLFVVKPAGFSLGSIVRDADGFANPAAADENGGVFIRAGDPFRATVTARDAEGTATPSYGKETVPEGVALASTLVLPAAGANPALSNASAFGAFASGSATGTTFAWGEVGIIRLTPAVADGDYLGAGTVAGTASGNVGRFIPFDFGSVSNAPEFAPACGRFSYLGQPFSYGTAPVITVTARNAGGIKTANYTGAFWKMTNASLSGKTYLAATGALDSSLLPAVDPVIVDSGDGTGTLTFSSGGGLGFVRGAPVAPFDAEIRLQINVQDSDGAAFAGNPAAFGNTVAGGGINFPVDPLDPLLQLKTMRFGRLSLQSAYGSELVPLRLPLRAEYYDGGGFVTNADDGCSSYDGTVATLGNYQLYLNDPETAASGAGFLIGGLFDPANPVQLSAPGAGNDGSVDLTLPVEFWLRYDWDGNGSHDNNPVGRGTFGIYGGTPRMIYTRETVR